MKVVLQRVSSASVTVDGTVKGSINRGIMILLGVETNDSEKEADWLAEKCAFLRIFEDNDGRMNLSAMDIKGEALVISQFTLCGDCSKGRRPNFLTAAVPEKGEYLYNYFVKMMKSHLSSVETGVFGAMMQVELVNDGPVTISLER
jgi:D-aminoacyl-tRNA deacylase